MAYRYSYRSRRLFKKQANRSKRNFIITLAILAILGYLTINWILPTFIGSIGFVKNIISPQKAVNKSSQNPTLAPPLFSIPYEATNSAQIDIKGYATANSKVRLFLDDQEQETISVSEDGSFTFEGISLSLGTNNIYGKTVDEQNRESLPSKTIKLFYTSEKPTLKISEPDDNKNVQGGDKKIKVSGTTNPGSKVLVNSSQAIVDSEGNFTYEQPLNDGDNIISIQAKDVAGNTTQLERKVIYIP